VHDAAATRGQYLALSKAWWSCSCCMQSLVYEYCTSCQKRLQWIVQVGAKRGLRKPNIDEVRQAKVSRSRQ